MKFSLKTAVSTAYFQLPKKKEQVMIKCPFCDGDMLINGEKFTCYHCFKTGDIVDFLVERDGISHKKAEMKATKNKPDAKTLNEIYRCNEIAAKYYSEKLFSENYFIKRGLAPETISGFKLGYAPFEGEELLSILKSEGISEPAIIVSGLFYLDNVLKPFFRNRAMFPIINENGKIAGFGGRRISENSNSPKYLNTGENLVFHKRNLLYGLNNAIGNDTVYLVEGYMDVIALNQSGVSNAVAALGTAIGENHCTLLRDCGIKNIVLCMDSDEAGIKSAKKSISILRNYFNVSVIILEGAKDPDEFVKNKGSEAFHNLKRIAAETFVVQNSENTEQINNAIKFLL